MSNTNSQTSTFDRDPRAQTRAWTFAVELGGHRVDERRRCPVCGGDSNCQVSLELAVLCRRKTDAPSGGELGKRMLASSQAISQWPGLAGELAATTKKNGGRIWAAVDKSGAVTLAPLMTPEREAREKGIIASIKEAKRAFAEVQWRRIASTKGTIGHPAAASYLRSRGLAPERWPDGALLPVVRCVMDAPTSYPVKKPIAPFDPAAKPKSTSPGMVLAVLNPRAPFVRGVHVTMLERAVVDGEEIWRKRTTGTQRVELASCDGAVVLASPLATPEKRYPGGVLVVGEGFETTASSFVSLCGGDDQSRAFTHWMLTDSDALKKLGAVVSGDGGEGSETAIAIPPVLREGVSEGTGIHTLVILVDLDKLTGSNGKNSRTGQRVAADAKQRLEREHPGLTVHLAYTQPEQFPTLCRRVLIESAADQEVAARGEFGCCAQLLADGSGWEEVQPIDPAKGVDWNDAIKACELATWREVMTNAILLGCDLEYNAERARLSIAPKISSAMSSVPAPRSLEHGAGTRSALSGAGQGRGEAGGGGGGGVGDRSDDWSVAAGQSQGVELHARYGPPGWDGLQWEEEREDEDGSKRRYTCISQRGLDRARLFLLQRCVVEGSRRFRVVVWGDLWYWWSKGVWHPITEAQIRGMVAEWLKDFWHVSVKDSGKRKYSRVDPSERSLTEVISKIAYETMVNVPRLPAWLPDNIDHEGRPKWGTAVLTWSAAEVDGEYSRVGPFDGADASDLVVDRKGLLKLSDMVELRRMVDKLDAGELDPSEARDVELRRLPHTPSLFTGATLPYAMDLEELAAACAFGFQRSQYELLCPNWGRTLDGWTNRKGAESAHESLRAERLAECDARVRQLGQMFGDSISGLRVNENVFLLMGVKRAGKGVLENALKASHGEQCIGATTITALGQTFGLKDLIGKSVALMSDAQVNSFSNAGGAVENLKIISGNGLVRVEPKFGDAFSVQLQCRFWILCNDEPDKLQDNSGALAGRYVIWPFTQSFYGSEDYRLKLGVLKEGAGIGVWAFAHFAELFAKDRPAINMTVMAREIAEEVSMTSSHMDGFARECLECSPLGLEGKAPLVETDEAKSVAFAELAAVYSHWCASTGKKPFGRNKIISKLRPLVSGGIRQTRPRDGDERQYMIVGIALKRTVPAEWLYEKPAKSVGASARDDADDGLVPV